MSGEQLERSILERKEREELKAIAAAMSLEPVARTKKADLVDQILAAAGVEVNQGSSANGTGSSAGGSGRRAASGASSPAETAASDVAVEGAGAGSTVGVADDSGNGKSPRPRTTRSRAAKTKVEPPDKTPAGEVGTESLVGRATDRTAPADAVPAPVAGPATGDGEATGVADSRTSAGGDAAESGGTASSDGDAAGERRPPRRSAAASRRGAQSNGVGSLTASPATGGAGAGDDASAPSTAAVAPVVDGGGGAASPAAAAAPPAGNADSATRQPVLDRPGSSVPPSPSGSIAPSQQRPGRPQQDRPQPDRQPGQGNQGNQGGQQGNQQGNQQGEVGNRRGRRRRGRERERGGEPQGGGQAADSWQGELVPVKGLVDLREEGYGFLRTSGYLASSKDVYVSVNQARRFSLRRGDALEGGCRPAGPSEKYPALLRIDTINGMTPDQARERPRFEDLTPLFPDERLRLESSTDPSNVTARIIDLISPIGKGQRGMIVSPSKAGKTTIMKQIAHSVELNNPDVHLMVLLVDERPEEVTDMRRSVKGEVIASTFDRPADEHTALSELTMERAKRLVEMGNDVVIILDGITRLARAYNLAQPATGRIMSGGVDSGALYPPKKFFGAARNVEEGGSLTILATALIETGSKMDEVIFEEFKGTGNMELRLDRKLAERRIYPAIDVNASSTRHEELLFDRSQLQQVWKLRRVLNALGAEGSAAAGLELLMDKIKTTRSNDEFLAEIAKAPTPSN